MQLLGSRPLEPQHSVRQHANLTESHLIVCQSDRGSPNTTQSDRELSDSTQWDSQSPQSSFFCLSYLVQYKSIAWSQRIGAGQYPTRSLLRKLRVTSRAATNTSRATKSTSRVATSTSRKATSTSRTKHKIFHFHESLFETFVASYCPPWKCLIEAFQSQACIACREMLGFQPHACIAHREMLGFQPHACIAQKSFYSTCSHRNLFIPYCNYLCKINLNDLMLLPSFPAEL